MADSLVGKKIKDTFKALLKFGDNDQLSGSLKQLSDGFGNLFPFFASSGNIRIHENTYPTVDGASGEVITTDGSGNLSFQPIAIGSVPVDGDISGTTSNARIKPNTVNIDKLAVSDGSAGQFLSTDGSGVLSFESVVNDVGQTYEIPYSNSVGNGFNFDNNFFFEGINKILRAPNAWIETFRANTITDVNGNGAVDFPESASMGGAFTFPKVDGTDGQAIITDGSGNTAWGNVAADASLGSLIPIDKVITQATPTTVFTITLNTPIEAGGYSCILDGIVNNGTDTTDNDSASKYFRAVVNYAQGDTNQGTPIVTEIIEGGTSTSEASTVDIASIALSVLVSGASNEVHSFQIDASGIGSETPQLSFTGTAQISQNNFEILTTDPAVIAQADELVSTSNGAVGFPQGIKVDEIVSEDGSGSPNFPNGLNLESNFPTTDDQDLDVLIRSGNAFFGFKTDDSGMVKKLSNMFFNGTNWEYMDDGNAMLTQQNKNEWSVWNADSGLAGVAVSNLRKQIAIQADKDGVTFPKGVRTDDRGIYNGVTVGSWVTVTTLPIGSAYNITAATRAGVDLDGYWMGRVVRSYDGVLRIHTMASNRLVSRDNGNGNFQLQNSGTGTTQIVVDNLKILQEV